MILINPAVSRIIFFFNDIGLVELRCGKWQLSEKVSLEQKCKKHTTLLCEEELVSLRDLKKGLGRHSFLIEAKTTYCDGRQHVFMVGPLLLNLPISFIQKGIKTIFCLFSSAICTYSIYVLLHIFFYTYSFILIFIIWNSRSTISCS